MIKRKWLILIGIAISMYYIIGCSRDDVYVTNVQVICDPDGRSPICNVGGRPACVEYQQSGRSRSGRLTPACIDRNNEVISGRSSSRSYEDMTCRDRSSRPICDDYGSRGSLDYRR